MSPFSNQGAPPPNEPPKATSAVVWLLALMGVGTLVFMIGAVAWILSRRVPPADSDEVAASSTARSGARLPPVERHVPQHAMSILDGCSDADVHAIASGIDGAIDVGAPLYNAGNFAGCYHLYEGTAADVERKLSDTCAGPRDALESGRTRAASLRGPSAQAWAMRDAFDGLIAVIARRP